VSGLVFVRSGFFVNTARVDPAVLCTEMSQLRMADTKDVTVGVMLGVTTECLLVAEGMGGPPNSPYPVHKISIVPFAQEMRRDTSVWGKVFGFDVITGAVSSRGISFHTKRKLDVPSGSLYLILFGMHFF
jgi:hypothetical protein